MKAMLLALLLVISTSSSIAKEFTSGHHTTNLIELYTSEGCSSCPPADNWLSALKQHPKLWQDFVPVAFHVNYWDYLGWKDRFAKPAYSKRQRSYNQRGASNSVYTPGFIVNGKEWRGYFGGHQNVPPTTTEAGQLTLSVEGNHYSAHYQALASDTTDDYILNVALLGMDLKTDVRRGENQGQVLPHDFVVLRLQKASGSADNWHGNLPPMNSEQQYAIAAWVTHKSQLRPLQATGGILN